MENPYITGIEGFFILESKVKLVMENGRAAVFETIHKMGYEISSRKHDSLSS